MNFDAHPQNVHIIEVGPRDGLQNEKTVLSTADKISYIEKLAKSGLSTIEITAFVNPKWIPALADQREVALGLTKEDRIKYMALVPNLRGYENARNSKIKHISIVLAASESHNKKNLNASTEICLKRYEEVTKQCQKDEIPFRAYVSCAFACPYEGAVNVKKVIEISQTLLNMGAQEISLGDTIGVANPKQVYNLLKELKNSIDLKKIALHLHDTRGIALANILAALEQGVTRFDASSGGLGGCPYAPGASGNVATEDLVYMLEEMGIKTGINLDLLCQASLFLEKKLNRNLSSKILTHYRENQNK